MSLPTIVSFYAGDKYYQEAAKRLQSDCQNLNLAHDIREKLELGERDWADICRLKIPFCKEMLMRYPQGIVWVDVDTRIIQRPALFEMGGFDLGAFLRHFKSFREYDPDLYGRRLHPAFLMFTGSARSRQFLDHVAAIEAASEVKGTDDYFFEEALRSFQHGLGIHIFNNESVGFSEADAEKQHVCFLFGRSGNVSSFLGQAEQHQPSAFGLNRERSVLVRHFRLAAKRGRRDEAEAIINAALRLDPAHQQTALVAAAYQVRIGKGAVALRSLRGAFDMKVAPDEAQRLAVEASLLIGNSAAARLSLRRLSRLPENDAYRRSREFRISLDERAAAQELEGDERPAIWWMEQPYPGNFGDVLNPYVVEKLSGIPPRYVAKGEGILAIGSVIRFARTGTKVWGSGTPRLSDSLAPDADYRAVRGPLTRELVLSSGGHVPEIYGDAAMLLPLIHPPVSKQRRLGLIRHYLHAHERVEIGPGVHEIDIARVGYDDLEAFIDEVTSCEAIISTSLHGLIVAHAYGVPTRRAIFSQSKEHIPGDGTKFSDHYAAFGIVELPPLDLSQEPAVNEELMVECTERVTRPLRRRALLEAAPFSVLPEILLKADQLDRADDNSMGVSFTTGASI